MSCELVALTLFDELTALKHPLVDSSRTQVEIDESGRNVMVGARLFDANGRMLTVDERFTENYALPGVLFTISPCSTQLHVERVYIEPDFQYRGLGRAVIESAIRASQNNGVKCVSLVADSQTVVQDRLRNALTYWHNVHGFTRVDSQRPYYLERRLD